MKINNQLLTVGDLAKALNVSQQSIYRMIEDDLLPYYSIRSSYRFRLSEVLNAIQYVPLYLSTRIGGEK